MAPGRSVYRRRPRQRSAAAWQCRRGRDAVAYAGMGSVPSCHAHAFAHSAGRRAKCLRLGTNTSRATAPGKWKLRGVKNAGGSLRRIWGRGQNRVRWRVRSRVSPVMRPSEAGRHFFLGAACMTHQVPLRRRLPPGRGRGRPCVNPVSCRGAPLRGGTVRRGRQARKVLRRCRQMDAKHADGPEIGMVVHGSDRSTTPWTAAPMRQPLSHPRVLRPSACICVKPFWLRREPLDAAPDPGSCAPAKTPCTNSPACRRCAVRAGRRPTSSTCCQNPMHQFTRLPPHGRPSGPEADIIDVLPEPHAPIHPPAAAAPSEQAGGRQHRRAARTPCTNSRAAFSARQQPGEGNTPCPAGSCPTGALHRLARSRLETMVRLAQIAQPTISMDRHL
jgi:hypothetical protein